MDMVKMSRRDMLIQGSTALAGLAFPWVAGGQAPKPRNTVTVLTEGYVRAVEGRQFIPGTTPDGARRVASTVALIQSESAIVVADPGMVTDRGLILDPLRKAGVSPQDVTHIIHILPRSQGGRMEMVEGRWRARLAMPTNGRILMGRSCVRSAGGAKQCQNRALGSA